MNILDPNFVACELLSEDELRAELNTLAQSIFARGDGIDLEAIVAQQWQRMDMDAVVDAAVEEAVAAVQQDEDLWTTFLSGWSPSRAEELAQRVAAVAFDSEPFRQAVEDLSQEIALDLEAEIGRLSAESVSANLLCLQQFIEGNYSSVVVDAFAEGIGRNSTDIDLAAGEGVDSGIMAVLGAHRSALGGVGVIVAAQLSRRLVQRIGAAISRRVAGRVAGRLLGRAGATIIPLAGWVVGGGLIVYDVLDSLDGALPQIEESLQSDDAKALIQAEIYASMAPALQRELPQIAREVANELTVEWLDFRRQYRQLLTLADQNPAVMQLLSQEEDLQKAAALLDAAIAVLGSGGVDDAVADGQFAALLAMPDAAALLLRESGSVETVLAWHTLAGSALDRVVALKLHTYLMPAELDRETLEMLLSVEDPEAAGRLAQLDGVALSAISTLSRATIAELALTFAPAELAVVGQLLDGMTPERRNQLITALQSHPNALNLIVAKDAANALTASPDLGAAIAFLETPADGYSMAADAVGVIRGSISLRLFGAKYGGWTTALLVGLPLLVALAIAYSLLMVLGRPFVGLYSLLSRKRRH